MNAKTLERILILRTIINGGGEMAGKDIADRASTECDHDLLEPLPPISRRGIGQKLQAMSLDGLVAHVLCKSPVLAERVSLWSITERGRELADSIVNASEPRDRTVGRGSCPTCGVSVRVVGSDEGTMHYEPVAGLSRAQADESLAPMALNVCAYCREGAGGECHTPGCAFWMNRAPDVPLRPVLSREEMIEASAKAIHGGGGCTCRAGARGDAEAVLIAAGVIPDARRPDERKAA